MAGDGRWPAHCLRLVRAGIDWELREGTDGYRVSEDSRGRRRVFLGIGHPLANSGGWQYLYRFRVAHDLGKLPPSDEHVHHVSGDRRDDFGELALVAISYHGRLEAHGATVAGRRGPDGRFRRLSFDEIEESGGERWLPRFAAIVGSAAYPPPIARVARPDSGYGTTAARSSSSNPCASAATSCVRSRRLMMRRALK